eukprot:scaffold490_cov222-Chaetoceros_neogracile.AAC.3
MPPRFPHGLKHNPIIMNNAEKSVLAMLGLSMGTGLYLLATSPLYTKEKKDNEKEEQKNETEDEKKKNYWFDV